jgi:hypothetical protein
MPTPSTDQMILEMWTKFVGPAAPTAAPAPPAAPPVAPPAANQRWWRPAADVVKPAPGTRFDGSEADALRFAGFGMRISDGQEMLGANDGPNIERYRLMCDGLRRALTAKDASVIVRRAGDLDTNASQFLVMEGWTQGGDTGFSPTTFANFPATGTSLSDVIALVLSGGGGQAGVFQS